MTKPKEEDGVTKYRVNRRVRDNKLGSLLVINFKIEAHPNRSANARQFC